MCQVWAYQRIPRLLRRLSIALVREFKDESSGSNRLASCGLGLGDGIGGESESESVLLSDSEQVGMASVRQRLRARTLRWSCIRRCSDRLSPSRGDGVPFWLRSRSP